MSFYNSLYYYIKIDDYSSYSKKNLNVKSRNLLEYQRNRSVLILKLTNN